MTLDQESLHDWLWQCTCFQVAAREQLGTVHDEAIFARAKQLVDQARRLHYPSSPHILRNESATQSPPIIPQAEVLVADPVRRPCPTCGEPIPTTWKKHEWKTDQTPCGWKL